MGDNSTKRIHAWLFPENEAQPLIPVIDNGVVFGCNGEKCDVLLHNLCADIKQASVDWDGENLVLKCFSNNNLSLINDSIPVDEITLLYHTDIIELAGERFVVHRCDRLLRPKKTAMIRYICENEIISEAEYSYGDVITFPNMPVVREEPDGIRVFSVWRTRGNDEIVLNPICGGEETYFAIYRNFDSQRDSSTVSSKEKLFLMSLNTYYLMEVPTGGLKFGGSRACECYFPGIDGVFAKLNSNSGELTTNSHDLVAVNGKKVLPGETIILCENDLLELCERKYKVIGKTSISHNNKVPVLIFENGNKMVFDDLAEGKSVVLGRDHQDKLSMIALVGREHAMISRDHDDYYLEDLASKNGTYWSKCGDSQEIRLSDGEKIKLGEGDIIKLSLLQLTFALE